MKSFFSTFIICFLSVAVFFFFLGGLLFESFWGLLIFIALIFSIAIHAYMELANKIENLEKEVSTLKGTEGDEGASEDDAKGTDN